MEEPQNTPQTPLTALNPKQVLGCKVEAGVHARWGALAKMRGLTPSQMLRKAIDRELDTSKNSPHKSEQPDRARATRLSGNEPNGPLSGTTELHSEKLYRCPKVACIPRTCLGANWRD